jgi:hypothetical protein
MPILPLWVELFRDSGRRLVDSCGFSDIEDAVDAVRELSEKAKRLHNGSWSTPCRARRFPWGRRATSARPFAAAKAPRLSSA